MITDDFQDSRLQAKLQQVAQLCVAGTFLIGLTGFAGWLFDVSMLRRPFDQFVAINPLTALLFMIGAASQLCFRKASRKLRIIGASLGACIMVAAAVKLAELSGGIKFAVDQLLFAPLLEQDLHNSMPNRMAPNTAFCFVWLGATIVLQPLGQRGPIFYAQFTLIPALLAASLSLLGYLYRVPKFYGILHYIPMPLHTAAGVLLFGFAVVAAYPREGILRHFTMTLEGSRLARWLIPTTVLVPILLGFLRLLTHWFYQIPVEFGVALLALSIITSLSLLLWFNTRILNLKDKNQRLAQSQLAELNANLEKNIKARAAAMLKTESRLRQVLDAMNEGFQIIGFDWRYLYVNDSVARQAKTPKDLLLRSTFLELFSTGANPDLMEAFRRCFKDRESFHIEHHFVYPDKSSGWFDLHFQPVPEGLFILSSDITERKQFEEHIKIQNDLLERKVAERTMQLSDLNSELEAFSYSVSHDLKGPLHTLDGYAAMLEQMIGNNIAPEAQEVLASMRGQVRRMERLIQDLLDLAKLGAQAIKAQPIDMRALVNDVVAEVNRRAATNAAVNIQDLHSVTADKELLRQVFYNLVGNAFKYSARSERPRVDIYSEQNGREIIYHVRDNGVGYDMAFADKLFSPFQRLHKASEYEGTGIGLAIVQRIIHKHGGRVWATSSPGNGATFSFSLPFSLQTSAA